MDGHVSAAVPRPPKRGCSSTMLYHAGDDGGMTAVAYLALNHGANDAEKLQPAPRHRHLAQAHV